MWRRTQRWRWRCWRLLRTGCSPPAPSRRPRSPTATSASLRGASPAPARCASPPMPAARQRSRTPASASWLRSLPAGTTSRPASSTCCRSRRKHSQSCWSAAGRSCSSLRRSSDGPLRMRTLCCWGRRSVLSRCVPPWICRRWWRGWRRRAPWRPSCCSCCGGSPRRGGGSAPTCCTCTRRWWPASRRGTSACGRGCGKCWPSPAPSWALPPLPARQLQVDCSVPLVTTRSLMHSYICSAVTLQNRGLALLAEGIAIPSTSGAAHRACMHEFPSAGVQLVTWSTRQETSLLFYFFVR